MVVKQAAADQQLHDLNVIEAPAMLIRTSRGVTCKPDPSYSVMSTTQPSPFSTLISAPIVAGIAVIAISTGVTHASSTSSDWAMFRGNNGQGIMETTDFPTEFGPDTNVAWKAAVPPAHSSPILVGDRIYLTGVDGQDLVTIALDRASGREVWRQAAPRPRTEKLDTRNGPAAASPVSDGSTVVVFFGDFGLIAYDRDGKSLWQVPLGPFNNVYGMGASPILVEDRVILAIDQQTNSSIFAVSLKTGERLWSAQRPEAKSGHSSPVLFQPEGGEPQVLMAGSFLLTSYSVATGEKLWWINGLPFEMKSTPSIADGNLFIHGYGSPLNEIDSTVSVPSWQEAKADDADGDNQITPEETSVSIAKEWLGFVDLNSNGKLGEDDWRYLQAALASKNSMIAIRLPGARATGDLTEEHVLWKHFRQVPQLPSPLTYQGALWMVNDRAITTVLDPATGTVLSQGRIEGLIDSIYASPIAGDGKVVITGRSGKIAVLSAKAAAAGKLESLAVNDMDEVIYATPALDATTLYVRTHTALYAFREARLTNEN